MTFLMKRRGKEAKWIIHQSHAQKGFKAKAYHPRSNED